MARSFLFLFPRFPPKFTVRILKRFNGDNSISFRFFLPRGKLEICDCREIIIFSVHPSSHLAQGKRARKKKRNRLFLSRFGGVSNRVKIFSSFQRCGGASFIRFSFDGRSNTNSHARPSSYFALRYCSRRGKKAKSDLIHRFKIFLLERSERKLHAHKIVFSNGSEH